MNIIYLDENEFKMSWLWLIHVRVILVYRLFLIGNWGNPWSTVYRKYIGYISSADLFELRNPWILLGLNYITLPAITEKNKVTIDQSKVNLFCGNNFAKIFKKIYLRIYLQIKTSTRDEIKRKRLTFNVGFSHVL